MDKNLTITCLRDKFHKFQQPNKIRESPNANQLTKTRLQTTKQSLHHHFKLDSNLKSTWVNQLAVNHAHKTRSEHATCWETPKLISCVVGQRSRRTHNGFSDDLRLRYTQCQHEHNLDRGNQPRVVCKGDREKDAEKTVGELMMAFDVQQWLRGSAKTWGR